MQSYVFFINWQKKLDYFFLISFFTPYIHAYLTKNEYICIVENIFCTTMDNTLIRLEDFQKEYSEDSLKDKLTRIARKAGVKVVYAVLVAYYAVQSDALSFRDKAKLYGALGYFILPVDLVPDSFLGMGYTDDLAALMFVLRTVSDNITPEVKMKAEEKLRTWFGDEVSGLSLF